MNCPECGNQVGDSDPFCPKCCACIEPLSLWRTFLSLFQRAARPGPHIVNIKKSVTIKTVGRDGEHHEYHSMDDVPPEIRSEIEALEEEAKKEKGNELSVTETSQTADAITSSIIRRKNVSVFKFIDASGVEHIYHSLDEMPPEIRTAIEQAKEKLE
jgi:hypothetical protein